MTDYISNINNIPIGGNIFDGLPTFVDTTLSSGVDLGPSDTFTSNLSSVLPNDSQDYMCMFEVTSNNLSGVSSTNGYYEITIHNSTTGDLNNNIWRAVAAGRYHNHSIGRANTVWLPIFANNRNVTLMQRSSGTDRGARVNSFKLKQYYRLGSNKDSGDYVSNVSITNHNIPVGGKILAAKEIPINIEPEAAFSFTGSEYKTYDLSQQIPSDGYAYEVLLQAYTRSSQNAYCRVYIGWVGADGNYKTAYLQNCGIDSNGSIAGANNQRIILQPNSRVIRFGNNSGSATGNCRLQVVSYKRLGTNE